QGGARCGPAHKQAVVRACARGGSGALLLHWPPELGASSAVTWGAHVIASCRATQPSVQSSLLSGYQLPTPLRTAGWHQARSKRSRSAEPSVAAAHSWRGSEGARDSKDRPRKTKKWSNPCRTERKTALWEGAKATSQKEIIDGDRLADLPLISDGLYPIDRSMMGWVERETIWKYSWRR
uniref:Uncharacterized protein n=1 Tax=Bos indicus x Bos taurus TaxID=30522 RepID=A0A4W2GB39_BOBOX